MIRAAIESRAKDDEGAFESLGDLIGFSGENKTRTVVRCALEAALASELDRLISVVEGHTCSDFCACKYEILRELRSNT